MADNVWRRSVGSGSAAARLVLTLLLIGALDAASAVSAADKITGSLVVRDALTMPGRPVMLQARLVQDRLLRQAGIGGEQLEFAVAGKKVGTAMTGGDGRALLEYIPRMPGNRVITVKLIPSKRVESPEATATLACWERRRPILLVEAATLVEVPSAPSLPFPSLPLESARPAGLTPAPDAADELKRLAEFFYNVIYLSSSDRQEIGKREDLREWLKQHRFPTGLSLTVNPGETALSAKIEEMKAEGWDNLKAGIGRTREFAEVLVEHRMEVVIVPEPERGDLPKKAKVAKDWKEARKKLQG
ncbi:MAG: hypothetical protein ACREI2_15835 [Nitrospiraceae bacterium]